MRKEKPFKAWVQRGRKKNWHGEKGTILADNTKNFETRGRGPDTKKAKGGGGEGQSLWTPPNPGVQKDKKSDTSPRSVPGGTPERGKSRNVG